MSVATTTTTTDLELAVTVIEGTIHEGPMPAPEAAPEAPEANEVPANHEARIAALKALWAKGTEDEELAWSDLSVARVLKARTAYLAGLLGSKTGQANNKAAMRILDLAQNTVRPYFLAGAALAEAGFEMSTAAPTASEIAIADPIISKAQGGRKRVKTETPDAGTSAGTGGTSAGGTDEDEAGSDTRPPAGTKTDPDEPTILADVIAAVELLQSTVTKFTRNQGFPTSVAENLQAVLAEIGVSIDTFTVDGGNS